MATAKKTAPAKKTTAVATRASGAVSVQDAMKAQIAKLAEKTAPATGAKIRVTQDKQFMLPDGTKTRDPLRLVIVDFQSFNAYYPDGFDKDNITPPACAALGEIPINLVPFDDSPDRQADTCKECPMNAWESDPRGGKGKACKNQRIAAVLPPDAEADTPMWTLKVSPTGIKGFDGYVNSLASKLQVAPFMVITTVSFDDSADYPSLKFSDPELIEDASVFADRTKEANDLLAAEKPDFSNYEAAPAKSTKKPAGRVPMKPAGRAASRGAEACMAVRKFLIGQALDSFNALKVHLTEMTEEEVLAALQLESTTRRRPSVTARLISRAARLNELSYVAKLKEKFHGTHPHPEDQG